MTRNLFNKAILLFVFLISSIFIFNYGNRKNTFYGDALGYYLYLPSAFIYNNIKTPYKIPEENIFWGILWYLNLKENKTEKGYYLDQYTYGVALMEAPFFFIAHGYEKIKKLPANGYSDTYNYLIKASSLFYSILGLLLIYYILKKYFTYTQSLLGTVIIFLCTNLFWFSIFQAGMAHVPLFFLYALLIYITIIIHEKPTIFLFIVTGVIAGIITLIRPTDILCLIIPLLYNVYNKETIRNKIMFLKENKRKIYYFTISFIIPIIPQLLYWKTITGSYVCYSYGSQSFNWSHPKILEGLFYFSNGWLPYSPIMIFSLTGFLFYRTIKKWAWCIFIIFPVYVYIIYSWYCYYYLNGFGSRPMIHLYPLLAIPLTAFIQYISKKVVLIKFTFGVLCLFFVSMNLCYSIQEVKGIIDSAESNMAFNFQMLFRMKLEYKDLIVKDIGEVQPDSNKLTKLRTLACENYEDSVSDHFIHDTIGGSKYFYHMKDQDYIEVAVIKYDKQKFKNARWFKCSGRFMCPQYPDYYKHILVLDINDKKKLWRGCNIENKIEDTTNSREHSDLSFNQCVINKWGYICYFARVPCNLKNGDVIKLIMWITNKTDIYMDDLCLELYQ